MLLLGGVSMHVSAKSLGRCLIHPEPRLPPGRRRGTGRRVGWMKAGHRWTWFIGLYAASVAALALATLALKRILAFLT